MEPDFSGYATKAGLKCSDGRTIKPEAFQHMDKVRVPLVWQHGHSSADNVLGHAILESRSDGVYAYGFFNDTPQGTNARKLVQHEDINRLSIYANQLVEKSKQVFHGMIREVSLVLSGANPGAIIDYVRIVHSDDPDDVTVREDEAIIHSGEFIELWVPEGEEDETIEHAGDDETVQDVLDSFNEDQRNVMYYIIGTVLENQKNSSAEHADNEEGALAHQEGSTEMRRNIFDQELGEQSGDGDKYTLTHSDMEGIFKDAVKNGSLKEAVLRFADAKGDVLKHGIESIDVLFPDAKNITNTPEFNKRRTEWVAQVLNGTRHTPFSRVKTIWADITQDEARAKGYVKGEYKKEEWFGVTKRTTTPTTVYKKQKLERDDVIDITDFDVVAWMKAEMRLMLEEEIARAILIGDGRDVGHDDKIKDPIGASDGAGLRSIANDHELFVTTLNVNVLDSNSNYEEVVDAVLDGMEFYKGTGTPDAYMTIKTQNMFLKAKDNEGRRYYKTVAEVEAALGVRKIITVEPMTDVPDILMIIVNLDDYNIGADKGGEVNLFDDFDIDYNNYKYLMETRISGALIKIKSALVVKRTLQAATLATPVKPTFVESTGVITIPTVTGVTYKNAAGTTLSAGAQTALAAGASLVVNAVPSSASYFFSDTVVDGPWTFKRPSA